MYSAAATAAIAALFNPIPALAAPDAPLSPAGPAVPDSGSRPMPLGTLLMPGQQATPTTNPTSPTGLTGVATSPVLQTIERNRAEIATLGDELIQVGQDRDLARDQQATAHQRYETAAAAMQEARSAAANVAAQSMIEAAALPPGSGFGLAGLDDLARLQRGDGDTEQAVARQVQTSETTVQLALDEETLAAKHHADLVKQYDTLNTQLSRKQAAEQAYELAHRTELNAAETTETATDNQLGSQYLAGAEAGRGADPKALQALTYALAQRGDPYVWSEEGPDEFDCSGLMYAAYHSVGFPLTRVSRDQYWQTRNKVVDRYSLLPGDLLFFSYSSSWRGIHHVAMYAGDGMMVEAPRTGLDVRLVPVRWSRLFQATRVFGSVQGTTEGPVLGTPDPEEPDATTPTTPPSSKPPTKPTKPTTPPTKPTTPPTSPSTPPTSPSTPPTSPSTPPSSPATPPTTKPTTTPPTTKPTTPPPTTPPPSSTPAATTPATTPNGTGGATSTSSSAAAEQTQSSAAESSAAKSASGSTGG